MEDTHYGHVTVLKIANHNHHGHQTVLKVAGHGHGGHVTVLKIAGGRGKRKDKNKEGDMF